MWPGDSLRYMLSVCFFHHHFLKFCIDCPSDILPMTMSCNFRASSSLAAKRRYTLKPPALAFLKLNMYDSYEFQDL